MDPASIFFLVPQRPLIDHLMSVPSCKKISSPRYDPPFPLWFFFSYTKKVPSPNIFLFFCLRLSSPKTRPSVMEVSP